MLIMFPTIDGSGSTFTMTLVCNVFKLRWPAHLDAEQGINALLGKGHIVCAVSNFGFWDDKNHMVGPYAALPKVEEWMEKADRIICSIRHPMRILGTAATMGRSHKRMVDSLLKYAEWDKRFNIFFVPVDVDESFTIAGDTVFEKRMTVMNGLTDFLGISRDLEVQKQWAKQWLVRNESNEFRTLQKPRDEAKAYLLEHWEAIVPLLHKVGYSDLLWWKSNHHEVAV